MDRDDRPLAAEVGVVGGGPAGAAIARRLATLGHSVCVVEHRRFPRHHVGESLPPGILPLLDALGVRRRIEAAGFLRPESAIVRWSRTAAGRSVDSEPGFQVDRGRFDQLLLTAATAAGAGCLQPARVLGLEPRDPGGWRLRLRADGRERFLDVAVLVDAGGKGSTVVPGRRRRRSPPTLALYGYWRQAAIRGPETRVEAGAREWFWGAPLPDGTLNATVFVDPERLRGSRRRDLEPLYRRLLAGSTLLAPCLEGCLTEPVRACDASSYAAVEPIGEDCLRIGEAAFSIDPLSSQGVQAAVRSALHGAAVVHTWLAAPRHAEAARRFYRQRLQATVARHRRWASRFYAAQDLFPASPFWRRRAAATASDRPAAPPAPAEGPPAGRLRLAAEVRIVEVPALTGDLIAPHPAVDHPGLDEPAAFVGDRALAALAADFGGAPTAAEIVSAWSMRMPRREAAQILAWLWSRGLVVAAADAPEGAK
jgi:flavin-dependent dehydrogenase